MARKLSPIKRFFLRVRICFYQIIDFLFSLYWDRKKVPVPDLEKRHSFLAESAVVLAEKIKKQELKSEDLVQAVIERMKQVNPIVNAVVEDRFAAALNDAREVDRLIASGVPDEALNKPFLGVPFTTKECQPIKGFRVTLGLVCRRNTKADEDSEAIIRLKQAGAIPLATTNCPELLVWQETRNRLYGTTKNPHHTGRSTGGSSGGEAALSACYATPISLCSDLGGSTRMPAFYCGLFGHHPTPGTTPVKDVFFYKGDEDSMFSLGFISKHAQDLPPLVKALAGPKAGLLNLDQEVNIKNIKFYYMESSCDILVNPIKPELKQAMNRVLSKITQEVESSPQPYEHEGLNHMYQLWSYCMSKEPVNTPLYYHNMEREANAFVELAKFLVGMSNHCFFSVVRLLEEKVMPKFSKWAEKLTNELRKDLYTKLGDNGVLLFPSSPHVAPYHYSCLLRPWDFSYWAAVNMLKCPATQVPLGKNRQGLPMGIQVVAAPHKDALCLAVAKFLENEFGGSVLACKIKQ